MNKMLREWAEYCMGGRIRSVFRSERIANRETGVDESFRTMIHVERFFLDRPWAREIALHGYGRSWPTVEALERWYWRRPGESLEAGLARMGWGFAKRPENPIPEVWARLHDEFSAWARENPLPVLHKSGILPDDPRDEPTLENSFVSVDGFIEMYHAVRGSRVGPETVRRWITEGRLKGAILHGRQYSIPVAALRSFAKPRRGRPRRAR